MQDKSTSTHDLCDIIPKLIWDARVQETRAETSKRELKLARDALTRATRVATRVQMEKHDIVMKILGHGCVSCGTTAHHLCRQCYDPLCTHCADEIGQLVDGRLICEECVQ